MLVAVGFRAGEGTRHSNPLPDVIPEEYLSGDYSASTFRARVAAAQEAIEKTVDWFEEEEDKDDDGEDEYEDNGGYAIKPLRPYPFEQVIAALPYCLPAHGNEKAWCPCSRYCEGWSDFFGLSKNSEMTEGIHYCGGNGKSMKDKGGLMQHLSAKQRDPIHFGTLAYLERLRKK
jgi:hypothetical protein